MAYTAENLHLRAGAPGDLSYTYDAGSDTLATVLVAGYFNNEDDDLNLTADDLVWVQATDGNAWFRVSSIDSGSAVTLQFAGGNLPIQTFATGTAAALNTLLAGYYEVGTSVATASRNVLPTPYAGAEVQIRKIDSGTQVFHFDAGGSGATGITYDGTNRRVELKTEGDGFHVVASSATRWRLRQLEFSGTGASATPTEGASVVLAGT